MCFQSFIHYFIHLFFLYIYSSKNLLTHSFTHPIRIFIKSLIEPLIQKSIYSHIFKHWLPYKSDYSLKYSFTRSSNHLFTLLLNHSFDHFQILHKLHKKKRVWWWKSCQWIQQLSKNLHLTIYWTTFTTCYFNNFQRTEWKNEWVNLN